MQCKKCGNVFPVKVIVDGKQRNLKNRKYCLSCSPFAKHNTKKLDDSKRQNARLGYCILCRKAIVRKSEKGRYCWACTSKKQRDENTAALQNFVGNSCWFCGYSRCWAALEFHHLDPKDKLFGLSKREMQYAWDRILVEARKCVLACACCHREIHAGIRPQNEVYDVWKLNWENK